MRLQVEACDLGLTESSGTCVIDTRAVPASSEPISRRGRAARALAGLGFHAVAIPLARTRATWPIAIVAHWFGASHLVAGATGYNGCPELGAIPSLVVRSKLATQCGPWEWIDRRIGA
jgi:hypothetical protein